MQSLLLISVRFLTPDPTYHGMRDGGRHEWPPSPLRLFQALVDAVSSQSRDDDSQIRAHSSMKWFERLGRPDIAAPAQVIGTPFRIAVPNNDLDVWAGPISKGNEPKKQSNELKTMKQIRPVHLNGEAVHYVYPLPDDSSTWHDFADTLALAARCITHLGWGIDMAIGDASIITADEAAKLDGVRWRPSLAGGTPLRVPKTGTLDDLMRKHQDFLNRVTADGFRPVPPLTAYDVVHYRSHLDPVSRPYRLFELRNIDGSRYRHPPARMMHLAGMVRHMAINRMEQPGFAPEGTPADWVEVFVAGHAREDGSEHQQISYLPLPSVGHEHTDPGIRRFMLVAPIGCDDWLAAIARRIAGQQLEPEVGNEFNGNDPPLLTPIRHDRVTDCYTQAATVWHSFTPVILPGHDDHKPAKRQKLIQRALAEAGIDQPCEFESSPYSHFRKAYSAHKYDRDRKPQGYLRPQHLLDLTAVHLTLRFGRREDPNNPQSPWIPTQNPVPGPLVIGAGRHCGFGLMVGEREQRTAPGT